MKSIELPKRPFFKRHERSFLILGTLLVLFSFVIKDVYLEKLKGVIESKRDEAQLFALRSDNTENQVSLVGLRTDMDEALRLLQRNDLVPDPSPHTAYVLEIVKNYGALVTDAIKESDSSWKDIQALMKDNPQSNAVLAEHQKLVAQQAQLEKQGAQLKNATFFAGNTESVIARLEPKNTVSAGIANDRFAALKKQGEELKRQASEFQKEVQRLRTVTSESAEKYRSVLEAQRRLVTYVSYSLFALGWMLSFWGKLYGGGDGVGGD